MRIYADVNRLGDLPASETVSVILQVGPSPEVGVATPVNGKFVVDIPDGVFPPRVDMASRLMNPVGNIVTDIYQGLLRAFPGYSNVVHNQLLGSADIDLLDPLGTFPHDPGPPARTWNSRFQTGTPTGVLKGISPGSVAILPENPHTVPPRPGLLVTKKIDISALTGGLGASNFLVYWKVYEVSVSQDVMNFTTGDNSPTIKSLVETDQDGVDVYLSVNDGAGYTPVTRLSPCVTCDPGTDVRLAFVNHNPFKVYLTAYAVMF
jgi:hypothetical protein